jgi:glycosyltransferase involved in cell wall biosynthesis
MADNDPKQIKEAEIIVGIPSYNEADNIAFVVKQVDRGLRKYFPKKSAVIINVDNNSTDGTKEAFLGVKTSIPKVYLSTRVGVKGKGNNFYNLFNFIKERSSKINIVVDADLKSIEPEWIRKMTMPIKRGYDFVTPFYIRNKRDALITNHFCYPLVYALLGWNISQPMGGDFAFSLDMVRHWLSKKWPVNAYQFGIDTFMTTEAILNDFKICQVDLGRKVHKPSQLKLKSMFIEVAMSLFEQLIINKRFWDNKKVKKAKIFYKEKIKRPQPLGLELQRFKDVCQLGFKADEEVIKKVLDPANYDGLKRHYDLRRNGIHSEMWSRIVYDFIYAYENFINKRELIEALEVIAFCRFFCYARAVQRMNFNKADQEITNQAEIFRRNRDYLLNKYKEK